MEAIERGSGAATLKIGEVAKKAGIGVESLRFYESRGLIEPIGRTSSGYRLYDSAVFDRLSFIRKSQAGGFSLAEIAWIISEARQGRRPCGEVRQMAKARLGELEQRLTELERFRDELRETVRVWECQGEADGVICGLIEGLEPGSPGRPPSRRGPDAGLNRPASRRKRQPRSS